MRTNARKVRCAALVMSAVLVAAACGDDDSGSGGASTAAGSGGATSEAPVTTAAPSDVVTTEASATTATESDAAVAGVDRDGEFRFGIQYGWASFGDPHKAVAEGDQIWFRPVYERLLSFGRTDEGGIALVPQLATDWELSNDGLALTFQLRDGVSFHDGNRFDADAVEANFERAMTLPDSTVKGVYSNVESVEVVDPLTVTVHLTQPDPSCRGPWPRR